MKKNLFVVIALFSLPLFCGKDAYAQSSPWKQEVGVQLVILRLGEFDPVNRLPNFPRTAGAGMVEPGIGIRYAYNFTGNIAVEAEANILPRHREASSGSFFNPTGGGKFQVMFGPKIGVRSKRVGLFAKARPGFVHFSEYPRISSVQKGVCTLPEGCPGQLFLITEHPVSTSLFAIDVGGIVGLYPSSRKVVRFDIGDTAIRYGGQSPRELNPHFTTHNLQITAGFGIRF